MHAAHHGIRIKRAPSRKRSRDGVKSNITPLKKKGTTGEERCLQQQRDGEVMTEDKLDENCSDHEDLFGDYDSIIADGSFMAKLEDVELGEVWSGSDCGHKRVSGSKQPCTTEGVPEQPQTGYTSLRPSNNSGVACASIESCSNAGIVFLLSGDLSEELPSSQVAFQHELLRRGEWNRNDIEGGQTSTPEGESTRRQLTFQSSTEGHGAEPCVQAKVSVTDRLKSAMRGNASVPSLGISTAAVRKEAVLTEEMGVALQAVEMGSSETDLGPFFGLPSKVKELISDLRGIKDLYDWQKACLEQDSVQQRRNLIYSLPTSGGKTLVAEILMLKELLCRRMDALLILPYISLVQEKVRGLASLGLELGFLVEEYAGSKGRFPPVKRRKKSSLYVATIEKGHSLVNSLVEAERLQDVGLLVVDELHMLGEGRRGALLEVTLAKVLYLSKSTQIIGMSATLSNVEDLQKFLKADNFTSDFRPVQLVEYVKMKDSIYEVLPKDEDCFRLSRVLNFKYSSTMQKADPDHIIALVTEVIPKNSCLVFCPSKKNCENVATMICKYLKRDFLEHRQEEKAVLLQELSSSGGGALCPVLRSTVPYGLAYHHSGLTSEERKLLEEAYSAGVLCLLACTSTLAAGVNLPARRVILRSPYVATDFLKRSQYKQMVGRAGRAGIDAFGESILILQEQDKLQAKKLLSSPVESCYSQLLYDNCQGIHSLILSLVGLKITKTLEQIGDFVSCTLLSVQEGHTSLEKSLWNITQDSLEFLRCKGLLAASTDCENNVVLEVTRLGRATYKGDETAMDTLLSGLKKLYTSLVSQVLNVL